MKVPFSPVTIEKHHYMAFDEWWREVRRLAVRAHFTWALGGKGLSRQFWDDGFAPGQYLSDLNME